MQVTLNYLQKCLYPDHDLSFIKEVFNMLKRRGWIYFEENLDMLTEAESFQIYSYEFPSAKSKINSFPVPIKHYQIFNQDVDQLLFLKCFYERYYKQSITLQKIKAYNIQRPFVGRDYLWFSQSLNKVLKADEA